MRNLEIVGYTADLLCLVMALPGSGERFRVEISSDLMQTLVEVIELAGDDARMELLRELKPAPRPIPDADAPSAGAALVSLGRVATDQPKVGRMESQVAESRLRPSEIQRMLRAGKRAETIADQAGVSLEWVLRWYQPIAAEQTKVITSVRGSRQEREGFGMSDTLIGDAIRMNLQEREIDADNDSVKWSASRPESRPYWTVSLQFRDNDRTRKATWRYDIGTGRVVPRDDLAVDLGWTMPITHPSPGRAHVSSSSGDADRPVTRSAPPPPPGPRPTKWAPPAPPSGPRSR